MKKYIKERVFVLFLPNVFINSCCDYLVLIVLLRRFCILKIRQTYYLLNRVFGFINAFNFIIVFFTIYPFTIHIQLIYNQRVFQIFINIDFINQVINIIMFKNALKPIINILMENFFHLCHLYRLIVPFFTTHSINLSI